MRQVPIGIENFKEMIDENCYYIDKTDLISEILKENIVFYTRPRRFGKTLNMSMLYSFFSNKETENKYLFDGLNISKNTEALKHQNQYPVIFVSLKEMKANTFQKAVSAFEILMKNTVLNNSELLDSLDVDESDRMILQDFRF